MSDVVMALTFTITAGLSFLCFVDDDNCCPGPQVRFLEALEEGKRTLISH